MTESNLLTAEAIKMVAQGGIWISPEVANRLEALSSAIFTDPADRAKFTQREREVIGLFVQGKTNGQIAYELHISERTVRFHLRNMALP